MKTFKCVILMLTVLLLKVCMGCNIWNTKGLPDVLRGYSYRIVSTSVNQTQTDCYKDTERLANKITLILTTLGHLGNNSLIYPLKLSNQLFVDLSNQMQSCSAITLIKQFNTRTSKMSGLFDLIFTIVYELAFNGQAYSTFVNNIQEKGTPCVLVGADIAVIVSQMLSYRAPVVDSLKMVRKFDTYGNEV